MLLFLYKKKYYKIFKSITAIVIFLFPINCYAEYEWEKIAEAKSGDVYYIDLSTIKKVGDNIFFLRLKDYIKPDKFGDLSNMIYGEVNCSNFDFKYYKDFYFSEPMGNGEPSTVYDEISEWYEVTKNSVGEYIYSFVCNYK